MAVCLVLAVALTVHPVVVRVAVACTSNAGHQSNFSGGIVKGAVTCPTGGGSSNNQPRTPKASSDGGNSGGTGTSGGVARRPVSTGPSIKETKMKKYQAAMAEYKTAMTGYRNALNSRAGFSAYQGSMAIAGDNALSVPKEPKAPVNPCADGACDYQPPATGGGPPPAGPAAQPAAPKITPQQVWVTVKASLPLDAATPKVGPDYSVHHVRSEVTGKPLDSVVGYPLWFWAEGGDLAAKSSTKKVAGMSVKLSMKPGKVVINTGDGHSFTCSNVGTKWTPQVEAGAKSPTCGYAYQETGTYNVSMTTQWTVHYEIDDGETKPLTGDETMSGTRERILRIGELQVVNVDG